MGITVATLVRNEADRYLPQALEVWGSFADEIIAIDDHSTDGTQELLRDANVTWKARHSTNLAWGAEAPAREELFSYACSLGFDWLFILDADMVPGNDPRDLVMQDPKGDTPTTVLFRLFDLWASEPGRLFYRDDGFWKGHENPRSWLISWSTVPQAPSWNERGLHCGHFPNNLAIERVLLAPINYSLLHYSYLDPLDREKKAQQYLLNSKHLSDFEIAHAGSIMAPAGITPLPFAPKWLIDKQRSSAARP